MVTCLCVQPLLCVVTALCLDRWSVCIADVMGGGRRMGLGEGGSGVGEQAGHWGVCGGGGGSVW